MSEQTDKQIEEDKDVQYEQKNLYATSATQGLTRTRWSVFIPDSGRENTPLSLQFPSRFVSSLSSD